MTEIRIAVSPETLALLEMSMREGDTYDAAITRLMKGVVVASAARAVRDDIAKSIDLAELKQWGEKSIRINNKPFEESACSAVMKTENILALDSAVKAVFDE